MQEDAISVNNLDDLKRLGQLNLLVGGFNPCEKYSSNWSISPK